MLILVCRAAGGKMHSNIVINFIPFCCRESWSPEARVGEPPFLWLVGYQQLTQARAPRAADPQRRKKSKLTKNQSPATSWTARVWEQIAGWRDGVSDYSSRRLQYNRPETENPVLYLHVWVGWEEGWTDGILAWHIFIHNSVFRRLSTSSVGLVTTKLLKAK